MDYPQTKVLLWLLPQTILTYPPKRGKTDDGLGIFKGWAAEGSMVACSNCCRSIEWIVLQEHSESTWKRSMRWLERDDVGLRPNSTNISLGAEFTWRTSCITRHASYEPLVSSSSDAATLFADGEQHTCCQGLRFPQPCKLAFAAGHSLRLKTEPSHTTSKWKGKVS